MYHTALSVLLRALLCLVAAVYLLVQPGGSVAKAALLSSQQVSDFVANKSALLTAYPDGGSKMAAAVRDLVLSDPSRPAVLNALVTLLRDLNTELQSPNTTDARKKVIAAQLAAIGRGLGWAALALLRENDGHPPDADVSYANGIAPLLADLNPIVVAAFTAGKGDVGIGSTGDGGGGSGTGVGGPINSSLPTGGGGGGTSGSTGSSGTSSGGTFTGGGGGGGSGSGSTGSTVGSSVSPQ